MTIDYCICVNLRSSAVNPTIDPSAALRTTVRVGPNGADRVLVDKGRRVMDIF